ncbi:MAG: hypothetical protein ABUS54_05195 [Actinomycetota bacterium]
MRGLGGTLLGLLALVLAAWGAWLIVRVLTGGMPDSRTGTIVGIGVVLLTIAFALGAGAVLSIRRTWRR